MSNDYTLLTPLERLELLAISEGRDPYARLSLRATACAIGRLRTKEYVGGGKPSVAELYVTIAGRRALEKTG